MSWIIILFLVVGTILLIALAENNEGGWAFFSSAALLMLYWIFFDKGLFSAFFGIVSTNPWLIVGGAFLWVLIGIFWSFYKWYIYLKKQKAKGAETARMKAAKVKVANHSFHDDESIAVESNKGRIITWMVYWPFSLLWFLIHNPITRFYNWIYSVTEKTYKRIYLSVFNEK